MPFPTANVRFSNRPVGVKCFRLSTATVSTSLAGSRFSSEWHCGPSIMGFEDKVERSLGRPCPTLTAGPSGHANSPHPSSREGHHTTAWWSSKFPPMAFDLSWLSCCYGCLSGPPELSAINPDAVHDHRHPPRQGDDRLFHSAAPGDLHRPGFEP